MKKNYNTDEERIAAGRAARKKYYWTTRGRATHSLCSKNRRERLKSTGRCVDCACPVDLIGYVTCSGCCKNVKNMSKLLN